MEMTALRHPALIKWENKLQDIFNSIDDHLEEKYGHTYPLHPSRAEKGSTGNRNHDGLFRLGAAFSAGFGSTYGPGYVIKVEMITLSNVPQDVRAKMEEETVVMLEEKLAETFPSQKLHVNRDGNVYKIHGDLGF